MILLLQSLDCIGKLGFCDCLANNIEPWNPRKNVYLPLLPATHYDNVVRNSYNLLQVVIFIVSHFAHIHSRFKCSNQKRHVHNPSWIVLCRGFQRNLTFSDCIVHEYRTQTGNITNCFSNCSESKVACLANI